MRIENDVYRVEVEETYGRICSIYLKRAGTELIGEARLADNFRILAPVASCQANYLDGKVQILSAWEFTPTGLLLRWNGPLVNGRGETFPIAVRMMIDFVGEALHFRLEVENHADLQIAEVWYPLLGGLTGLGDGEERKGTCALVPEGYAQWTGQPFNEFGRACDIGTPYPERFFAYPGNMSMAWVDFYHPALGYGVYWSVHDSVPRCKAYRMSLIPGTATLRKGGDWPTPAETGDLPVGMEANWAFFPYTPAGETFQGPPVVLQQHAGDWRAAAALYRAWFTGAFPIIDSHNAWIRRETAHLDLMFLLPEGNVNMTFRDIPQWAQAAIEHGVHAVLISGWQVGGHDRGYPYYSPDPRLGTWEELKAGIDACHALGVKVFFFMNLQVVDVDTDWYRAELHRYLQTAPDGTPIQVMGFGMGTLAARMGSTRPTLMGVDMAFPPMRRLIVEQSARLVELGADGIHYDKICLHNLDFNPDVPYPPDQAPFIGVLQCLDEIIDTCTAVNPDFCISIEGPWDRLLKYTDVCWWANDVHSVKKVTFPQWAPVTSIIQPYEFTRVNLAVLFGHHLLVGPGNYNRGMDYPPMQPLCRYIGEITRLRSELLDYLSRGTLGSEDEVHLTTPATLRWSIFHHETTGKRACVLVNLEQTPQQVTIDGFTGDAGPCRLYQPFQPAQEVTFPLTIELVGERLAVIVEE